MPHILTNLRVIFVSAFFRIWQISQNEIPFLWNLIAASDSSSAKGFHLENMKNLIFFTFVFKFSIFTVSRS